MTGGAVRVGRAIAVALARAGMDVAIGYHRSAGDARRAVADIEGRKRKSHAGLAGALRSRRIAVNCVAPGAVLRPT